MNNTALKQISILSDTPILTKDISGLLSDLYKLTELIKEDSELSDEDVTILRGNIYVNIDGETYPIDEYFSNRVLHSSRMSKYNRGIIHGYESCLAVAEKWFGKKSKVYKSLNKDFEKMIKSDYDIDV